MGLTHLQINNFRNFFSAELTCDQTGLNIISGDNGSGKTSLLEAIYYLGWGRSFRTSSPSQLIRRTTDKFSIIAQITNHMHTGPVISVERDCHQAKWRIAQKDIATITELMSLFPVRLLDVHSHALLEAGPMLRRRYLDWGIFYQSETFLSCWRQFDHALKQRNRILRLQGSTQELGAWTTTFVQYGLVLDKIRREYVARLTPILIEIIANLFDDMPVEITYQPGWPIENIVWEQAREKLVSALEEGRAMEQRVGYTLYGPQRADFVINLLGEAAKQFLSRGQQKLLIYAMIIAQGKLLQEAVNKQVIYLVDDLPAELDSCQKNKALQLLISQQAQIFMTTIDYRAIDDCKMTLCRVPTKMFHVKQNNIHPQ